jgi:hypothetical protein
MVGYLHNAYAQSLSDHGEIIFLPHSKGWILKRKIPNSYYTDGMGIYPLFFCENWDGLLKDFEEIKNDLVCFSIVTDPFGKFRKTNLKQAFKDAFFPFKEHYVIDLSKPLDKIIAKHHLRNLKKAQKEIRVERCESPQLVANEWLKLYKHLIKIHNIKGIPSFSEKALTQQLNVPGAKVFRGIHKNNTVGMLVWYIHNNIGYYHLGASSDTGYRLNVSFALFWESLKYFCSVGYDWINLGAGAGINGNVTSGLTRFKKGWSTGTKTVYFCGRIFNRKHYNEILNKSKNNSFDYFPAYRKGEFS